ncbi:MAG: ArsI/CadI family heavy metal resistance metalloenzyme [Acidimicrobiales bacterium]
MRLQLALDVSDIDAAVEFYSKLFDTEPAKRKPGYANFAIENPPLKLVLFENAANAGGINHLGVETETSEQVEAAEARLDDSGLETTGVADTVCCYAGKTETWVVGPDRERWEWYVKTSDEADFGTDSIASLISVTGVDGGGDAAGACCS